MGAAAEIYITVDIASADHREEIEQSIDKSLESLGFDVVNEKNYNIGRYPSGIIVECKSYGCSWDVFEEDWAEKLVREIHAIDETSNVELFVYNLEREADVSMSSAYLFSENYKEKGYRRSPLAL
jgi:hypothetical protein